MSEIFPNPFGSTRGSLLARTQSGIVAAELSRKHPGFAWS